MLKGGWKLCGSHSYKLQNSIVRKFEGKHLPKLENLCKFLSEATIVEIWAQYKH